MNLAQPDTSWEYSGTPDHILVRHDHTQSLYIPPNYPDLSDKKW